MDKPTCPNCGSDDLRPVQVPACGSLVLRCHPCWERDFEAGLERIVVTPATDEHIALLSLTPPDHGLREPPEDHPSRGCPCLYADRPCHPNCTCLVWHSSRGCACCAAYGSLDQRRERANVLVQASAQL